MKIFKNLFGKGDKIHADEIAVAPGLLLGGAVIVESGENENGNYVKFGNGTMVCWITMLVTDQAINTAYGSLYQGVRAWTFPSPFIKMPMVSCSEFKWSNGASWGTVSAANREYALLRGIDILPRSAGEATGISAIAIGKWK